MFPNRIRESALAVSGVAQGNADALISVSFPSPVLSPGLSITYLGYMLAAAASFFFVRNLVHETRGRELEDVLG